MPYYTYIIYSAKTDKYYVGSCQEMELRLQQHNAGRNKSTKSGIPWSLKYTEDFETRSEAIKREIEIKRKKSRHHIEQLISSTG